MKYTKAGFFALACIVNAMLSVAMRAETLYLEDFSFTISNPQGSEVLSARWGVWNGSQFVQAVTSASNAGYVDVAGPEIGVSLSQTNNTTFAQGSQMALAIFTDGSADAQSLNWNQGTYAAVLVDSSWIAPAFNNNANFVNFNFSSSTSAVRGSFNYNGGNETIGLVSAVPEPTTYAALFSVATLGFCIWRKRRQAA
jgi:hypothetical protein